jgi:hypothetical protein
MRVPGARTRSAANHTNCVRPDRAVLSNAPSPTLRSLLSGWWRGWSNALAVSQFSVHFRFFIFVLCGSCKITISLSDDVTLGPGSTLQCAVADLSVFVKRVVERIVQQTIRRPYSGSFGFLFMSVWPFCPQNGCFTSLRHDPRQHSVSVSPLARQKTPGPGSTLQCAVADLSVFVKRVVERIVQQRIPSALQRSVLTLLAVLARAKTSGTGQYSPMRRRRPFGLC